MSVEAPVLETLIARSLRIPIPDAHCRLQHSMGRGIRVHVPPLWAEAIEGWLNWLRAAGRRAQTLYTSRQRLERTARHLAIADPWQVTEDALLDYFGAQVSWSAETRRGHRTSLRSFYAWGVERGHIAASPALALPRVKPSEPNPMPAPDAVYLPALAAAGPRERLMLQLARDHGLRRGEIVLVHTGRDVVEDLTGWSLVVHGKGGKERVVPLLDETAVLLMSLPRGWAFPGDVDGHMSARWCGKLVNRLLPGVWTIHKLRHRAATEWWEASDHDLLEVATLLGHASTVTTQRYVPGSDARRRSIVNGAKTAAEERRHALRPA